MFLCESLIASFRKIGYFPFAASINIISYFSLNVGSISTAFPINTFIVFVKFISFIFLIASLALSSSSSIVSINIDEESSSIQFSNNIVAKQIEE